MTAPSAPTETTIVTEALKRFLNGSTPNATDVNRAIDYGLQKVKRDIMLLGQNWRPLIKTAYDITKAGVPQYANPSDYASDLSVGLMSGDHTGAIGTVTSASIMNLAATEDVTQAQAEGQMLLITSGTGVDQAEAIDDYSATTKQATLQSALTTAPVTGDGYMVVDSIKPLRDMPLKLYDLYQYPGASGEPKRYCIIQNSTVGVLALYPVPNAVYGLRRRYYADLLLLDTSSTLYSSLLRRWAGVFEQGVYVWKLGEDDDRYSAENEIYKGVLLALMTQDLDGYSAEVSQPAQQ